ncbi:ATP-binding protein [Streptomyces griseoviridis]
MSAPDHPAVPAPWWPPEADARHLQARLLVLETRVRQLLDAGHDRAPRFSLDPSPARPGEANVENAAHPPRGPMEEWADRAEREEGGALRLHRLQRAFGLDGTELDAWIAAAAPHLDCRFAALYREFEGVGPFGHATPALTARLAGLPDTAAYALWGATAPLRAGGLADLTGPSETGFLARPLLPAHRIVAFTTGDDQLDDALLPAARLVEAPLVVPGVCAEHTVRQLAAAAAASVPFVYVRQHPGAHVLEAAAATAGGGHRVLHLDLGRTGPPEDAAPVLAAARREAHLRGCPLIAGPVEALDTSHDDTRTRHELLRVLTSPAAHGTPAPLILFGSKPWDHSAPDPAPLRIDAPSPTAEDRRRLWEHRLAGTPLAQQARTWARFPLPPRQAGQAVTSALHRARVEARPVTDADLRTAIRAHTAPELEHLARRIVPAATLDDLVLPPGPRAEVEHLLVRARHRDLVLGTWRMSPGNARGHGVVALFSGPSGTGKTLAAEALAHALGGDLYVVNLATVVDKYIGETEKNLDRVLTHAAHAPGVLLFDEADALFSRRSAVKDAHDRHANTQTAHLLQRLEAFEGVAVLTTNLTGNIDDAFTRRLDSITHFPLPDAVQRRTLWHVCLGPHAPRSPALDLDRVAAAFPLAGGSIRSCAVSAAYRAADRDAPVTTRDLVDAIETEYRKLGRLVDADTFDAHRAAAAPTADPAPAR